MQADTSADRVNLASEAALWRSLITSRDWYAFYAEPFELPSALEHSDLLVVPGPVSLLPAHLEQIVQFVESGGAALFCEDWLELARRLNLREVQDVERRLGLSFDWVFPRAGRQEVQAAALLIPSTPLTLGIPPAFQLEVANRPKQIGGLLLRPDDVVAAAWWYGADRGFAGARLSWTDQVAIAYGHAGRGRHVWFGFLGSHANLLALEHRNAWRRVVDNALDWCRNRPVADARFWPMHYSSAIVLSFICRDRVDATARVLGLLRQHEVPQASFFVVSEYIERNLPLVREMMRRGEVGLAGEAVLGGLPLEEQYQIMLGYLQGAIDRARQMDPPLLFDPRGFLPSQLDYDSQTLRAAGQLGFNYLVTQWVLPMPNPQIRPEPQPALIPTWATDDYTIIEKFKAKAPEQFTDHVLREMEQILAVGGLYHFLSETRRVGSDPIVDAMDTILAALPREGCWITTCGELAHWVRMRAALRVQLLPHERAGGFESTLVVTNAGRDHTLPFEVEISVPSESLPPAHAQQEQAEALGARETQEPPDPQAPARAALEVFADRLRVSIEGMPPQSERTYIVRYTGEGEPSVELVGTEFTPEPAPAPEPDLTPEQKREEELRRLQEQIRATLGTPAPAPPPAPAPAAAAP